MPRTTRKSEVPAEVRPFAAESVAPFASLDASGKSAVASAVAADKAGGLSGNDLRAKYGERLSGPARRKLLRAHGFDGPGYVAPSYDEYRDGDPRKGTQHAKEHGANSSASVLAIAERTVASATAKECREAIRAVGGKPPRVSSGDETALRAATVAALVERASERLASATR